MTAAASSEPPAKEATPPAPAKEATPPAPAADATPAPKVRLIFIQGIDSKVQMKKNYSKMLAEFITKIDRLIFHSKQVPAPAVPDLKDQKQCEEILKSVDTKMASAPASSVRTFL